jgi:hypothetical protein
MMLEKIGISLKEPSTWAGIVAFLGLVGVHVAPEHEATIVQFGVALGALLGIVFKWEKPAPLSEVLAEGRDEAKD